MYCNRSIYAQLHFDYYYNLDLALLIMCKFGFENVYRRNCVLNFREYTQVHDSIV